MSSAQPEKLLQTVVALVVYDKMHLPKQTHGRTVIKAGWSNDGKTLFLFSANWQSVSLWELVEIDAI